MFGFGNGKRHGKQHRKRLGKCAGKPLDLNEAEVGKKYIILDNPDVKTMEMGLYRSGVIIVHKNEEDNPNIVIGVGESRYIIPRDLAKKIIIR